MIISVTERGTFKRCRQLWDYASRSRQSIEPLRAPTALEFGTLVHKMHETWLNKPSLTVDELTAVVSIKAEEELRENYKTVVGTAPSEQELGNFYDQIHLAHEIFNNYFDCYGASLPEGYTLIKAEQTAVIPIPGTEHICNCQMWLPTPPLNPDCPDCQGTGRAWHYLEATFDGLIQDEWGRLWILERKTYNSRPKESGLQTNDQFLGYLWALTQLDIGPVGGILYDGMWKRYRKAERKVYTNEELFFRVPLIRSPLELANFTNQLRDEALDMADPNLRIYRNLRWEGCWDCSFEQLCLSEFRGEDAESLRATRFMPRKKSEWQQTETLSL